jgi:hypothetical protein
MNRCKRWIPFGVAFIVGSVIWRLHPPLYNGDGYILYFRGANDLIHNIHPHHVIWVPIIRVLKQIAQTLRLNPMTFVQLMGVIATTAASFLTFKLLRRFDLNNFLAGLFVLFAFWSPWIWHLSTQAQPYPAVILLSALLLSLSSDRNGSPASTRRLMLGGAFVAGAACLHQAACLWVVVVAFYVWQESPTETRWGRSLFFGCGTTALILFVYALAIHSQHFQNQRDTFRWLTEFARTQHGLQFRLPDSLFQTAAGILRSLVQTHSIESWLWRYFTAEPIMWIYMTAFSSLIVSIGLAFARTPSPVLDKDCRSLVLLSAFLLASWCLFCVLWEPANYYWCIGVVPTLCLGAYFFGPWLNKHKALCATALIGLTGWNVYANYDQDRYYARGSVPVAVPKIVSQLTDKDRFIVMVRGQPRNANYDLLETALGDVGRENVNFLVDDFILDEQNSSDWSARLKQYFKDTWDDGGRVFLSTDLLQSYAYDVAGSALSAYRPSKYQNCDANDLYRAMVLILNNYFLKSSSFQIGDDKFVELRPRLTHR